MQTLHTVKDLDYRPHLLPLECWDCTPGSVSRIFKEKESTESSGSSKAKPLEAITGSMIIMKDALKVFWWRKSF